MFLSVGGGRKISNEIASGKASRRSVLLIFLFGFGFLEKTKIIKITFLTMLVSR